MSQLKVWWIKPGILPALVEPALHTRMPTAEIEASLASLLVHKDRNGRMVQSATGYRSRA